MGVPEVACMLPRLSGGPTPLGVGGIEGSRLMDG
jgi:hypothetical protein